MKKLLTLILALILSFSVVLTLVACGDGDGNGAGDNTADGGANNDGTDNGGNNGGAENDNAGNGSEGGGNNGGDNAGDNQGGESGGEGGAQDPNSEYFNENGELILYKDGVPTFRFIIGSGIGQAGSEVGTIISTLNGLSKQNVKQYTTSEAPVPVEILVGTVNNRGDEYKINKYDLGMQGYMVKQIGTKIVVLGGSDAALLTAVNYLKSTVFGLKKSNDDFDDFVMAEGTNKEYVQSGYSVTSLTIGAASIKDCAIYYDATSSEAKTIATSLRDRLYEELGVYPDLIRGLEKHDGTSPAIIIKGLANDGEGGGYYISLENSVLKIECEYRGRFEKLANEFFNTYIFDRRGPVIIENGYSYEPDLRNVTYEEYGAYGNGTTDDFFAIKAAHDAANIDRLNVHASPTACYYIGKENGDQSIIIKTNTYWHGCQFIFDDSIIGHKTPGRTASIFIVEKDSSSIKYSGNKLPITSLEKGAENIGWAPGREVMLIPYNANVKHYIREGLNQNNGDSQHELIIVDAEGNVDPSTPIQWTYETVTSLTLYYVDDEPIEILGADEKGKMCTITTIFNQGPSDYFYYSRNIHITRSNVILSGINHVHEGITPQDEGGDASPYTGFTSVHYANNVIIENMIFTHPESYYVEDEDGNKTQNNMGSYELSAGNSNNVTWRHCRQSNFYEPDGSVKFRGMMGTNFCKNLNFDDMFVCSFDAHCGVYNATIKNSTIEHLNFIGAGLVIYENVTVYTDGSYCGLNFRPDYGSTWDGDVYIDGLVLKMAHNASTTKKNNLAILKGTWTNWNFGYTTYLVQNMTIKNLVTVSYRYWFDDLGIRQEEVVAYNEIPVRIISTGFDKSDGITNPDSYISFGNYIGTNVNPMVGMKSIVLETKYTGEYATWGIEKPVNITWQTSDLMKNCKVKIDGITYSSPSKIPKQ